MQKLDTRRKSSLGWIAAIIVSLAVAPAFGAGPTEAAGGDPVEPATEETAAETRSLPATPSGPTEVSVEAVTHLTWQLLSQEYCPDRFATTCPNGATAADPCPVSEPEGKPCSISGDRCWYVISAWWAEEYRCLSGS